MEENDLIIFQEVHSMEEAIDIESILMQNGISCKIIQNNSSFDPSTGQSETEKMTVQVLRLDYDKAREVMIQFAEKMDMPIIDNHYFHDFTNEELMEVLENEDDWSPEDVVYARKLLNTKNIHLDEDEIYRKNENGRFERDKAEHISTVHFLLGMLSAVSGGIFGIAFGIYLLTAKKNDRHGNRIPAYDSSSRKKGNLILLIGIAAIISILIYYYGDL